MDNNMMELNLNEMETVNGGKTSEEVKKLTIGGSATMGPIGGAIAGGSLGTMVPVIGTAIGATVGGIIGGAVGGVGAAIKVFFFDD